MSKKLKIKRPNPFVWMIMILFLVAVSIFRRKVKITYKTETGEILKERKARKKLKELKAPFVLLGNHHSMYDYVFPMRAMFPRRINYMVARKHVVASPYRFFLKHSYTIPKSLFQTDIPALRGAFDVIAQKGILAIYPEGQILVHGISKELPEQVSKLLKKLKVPVLIQRTSGAYFVDSTWRKKLPKGVVEAEFSLVLTPEQLAEYPLEKIDEIVAKSLYVDNFKWQEETGNLYKGKNRAAGLENILYICPCCKKEFSLQTKDDMIICQNCGLEVRYNEACHFDWKQEKYFKHIGEWYNYQRDVEFENHKKGDFKIDFPVELKLLAEKNTVIKGSNDFEIRKTKRIEKAGEGILSLRNDKYFYKGMIFGKEAEINFNPKSVQFLPYTPGDNFQIYLQDVMFAFHPKEPKICSKIALSIESYYEYLQQK